MSHTAHLASAIVLFHLTKLVSAKSSLPLIAATLHIISPAGAFLASPYTESLFSLCSFLGYYFYAQSLNELHHGRLFRKNLAIILAGAIFGVGTTVRNNGILTGSMFLYDLVVVAFTSLTKGLSWNSISRAISLIVGGLLVGCGMVAPQLQAYNKFCRGEASQVRPWCEAIFPSIYNFVQSHYW